jgi:hypothetical protein
MILAMYSSSAYDVSDLYPGMVLVFVLQDAIHSKSALEARLGLFLVGVPAPKS